MGKYYSLRKNYVLKFCGKSIFVNVCEFVQDQYFSEDLAARINAAEAISYELNSNNFAGGFRFSLNHGTICAIPQQSGYCVLF